MSSARGKSRAARGRGERLCQAARRLRRDVSDLSFGAPVSHVYHPLSYAARTHFQYLRRFGDGPKRVVLLGMNPGPFGMAQTGVPFGEIAHVRDWMGIRGPVARPPREHPRRPIEGFACRRSEVSGARLWGAAAAHFGSAEAFFAQHFVANYCPLVFLEASGRNRTPDKLSAAEREPLFAACDRHLRRVVEVLEPEWVIGVGGFAAARAREALTGALAPKLGQILHPSPANPRAQRGWDRTARRQLADQGVCSGQEPEPAPCGP